MKPTKEKRTSTLMHPSLQVIKNAVVQRALMNKRAMQEPTQTKKTRLTQTMNIMVYNTTCSLTMESRALCQMKEFFNLKGL